MKLYYPDRRIEDGIWNIDYNPATKAIPADDAHLCVLMDIRRELKSINAILRTLSRKLPAPRRRKK